MAMEIVVPPEYEKATFALTGYFLHILLQKTAVSDFFLLLEVMQLTDNKHTFE